MKKMILLSLVVSSFVMGRTSVDNLIIDQESTINSSSRIDNAVVHQGRTKITGDSDVDDLKIIQKAITDNGNLIENSEIVGNSNGISVLQGTTTIQNSSATNLTFQSENRIKNIELLGSTIEQGSVYILDSNITDSTNVNLLDIKSINMVEDTSVDSNLDVNTTEIKQSVVTFSSNTIADLVVVNHANEVLNSTVSDTNISQGILTVQESEIDDLSISGGYGVNINSITASTIEGKSILQSSIYIYNNSYVTNLNSKSTNTIDTVNSTDSIISQAETNIH